MTRGFLRVICRTLIGVFLFAQMAISAYACPLLSLGEKMGAPMSAATSLDDAGKALADPVDQRVPDCAGMAEPMDTEFANLCAEHCHHGQQSDQATTLTVPAALLTTLYITPLAPVPFVAPRRAADTISALAAASPPHTILHCCFRI
jgi:hypothetical protein